MKWCRNPRLLAWSLLLGGGILIVLADARLRAEMSSWLQYLEANSIEEVFFRSVAWPNGAVRTRRPPAETRPSLTSLIAASPSNAALYRLRASEAELQLDSTAAEADWQKYAQTVQYPAEGQLSLAEFYHRRLRPLEEMKALRAAVLAPSPASERLTPYPDQRSWHTFARMFELIRVQQLPAELIDQTYRDWMARYPTERDPYTQYFDYLRDHGQFDAAQQQLAAYQKAFPDDQTYPFTARAGLELHRGNAVQALALYEREFQPLWPSELVTSYFDELEKTGRLRAYLAESRATVQKNPDDLRAAAKLFFCLRKLGNEPAARHALVEFRLRKEARHATWTADELATLARLFRDANDPNECIRHYYALYSLPGAPASAREQALAGIADILLSSPEQPIHFGSGDLSLYRDIATMDPYPGYLNGILSLLLNSESPRQSLAAQEEVSVAYFHRARASELVGLFDKEFPQSPGRPALHARLIEAYAIYGDTDGVIRHGRQFLNAFPTSPERTRVALSMSDAYARKGQSQEEFALYDDLLKELAAKAGGVPLGRLPEPPVPPTAGSEPRAKPATAPDTSTSARSPEYARMLDRYISRLVSMDRVMDALAVCRREIDRNPDDPGLYERLAAFLDQNHLGAQVEGVYRKAMERFQDASWTGKLARWYLRRQRRAEFQKLTLDVVKVFAGTDLEKYFQQLVNVSAVGPAAYLQVNVYAHQRFPNNLQFVRNLLNAYSRKETNDRRAYKDLLRQYWFYDDALRQAFLSNYAREEQPEVDALQTQADNTSQLAAGNPSGARLVAEMAAWRSHFEEAAPVFEALAAQYPGDSSIALRAAAVHRSLAAYRTEYAAKAVALVENVAKYDPRSRAALTDAGEIHADGEHFSQARPWWNRIPQIEPGSADGYLEAATVFWDYFQFDDAQRLLAQGRQKLSDPTLYAYQAGAIYEGKGEFERAVKEYVKGALASTETGTEGTSPARSRLLQLSRRPALRAILDAQTASITTGKNPSRPAVALRVSILEQQNRRDDIAMLLLSLAHDSDSPELLQDLGSTAARLGFENVREAVLERQIAMASDDVERIRLRLALARYYESKPDLAAARKVIEDVVRANPAILGVVRAATDFYWRNHLADQAVDTLATAARSSNAAFKKEFAFEAAGKATESGKYARARDLLNDLLAAEPFNADYLAAMASTYARAGEYQPLRDFYSARIAEMNRAPIPAAERNERVAGLRRGLIPALERLGDHTAAVDQYIEIINRYPEDENLLKDAALFAIRHELQSRLSAYYTKASTGSPKDVRLHLVLARLQTQFEDYPAAVSAYDHAIAVRPDRLDLRISQAQLLEKLARFDQATVAYRNIYNLSYHDPRWLLKVAELLARGRQPTEAVKAVESALIEGRPERPGLFFDAAAMLEKWGLLQEAAAFAERGVDRAGARLLIDQRDGVEIYARIMTRLRKHEQAYQRLYAAQQAGMQLPQREAVPQLADVALRQIGQIAKIYFSPEEKVSLAAFLEKSWTAAGNPATWKNSLLQLAQLAGLKEREVRWQFELLMAEPDTPAAAAHLERIIELQKSRLQFAELGSQLERYWRAKSDRINQLGLLTQAAQCFAIAGDTESEFRVLSQNPAGTDLHRYLDLLQTRDPERRLKLAASSYPGMQIAIEAGDSAFARAVISLGGSSKAKPVWARAYLGLVGLYYRDPAVEVNQAFSGLLGGGTIGERLGKTIDRDQQLAGDAWFYFGSRYGEYLAATNQNASEDYLPAMLEGTPARAANYMALAQSYEELGRHDSAVAEYEDGLQFDPNAGDAHNAIANILWPQGKQDEAVAQWRLALEAFRRQENSGHVPPEFWHNVERTLTAIGERKILPAVRTQADQLLHDYIRINGAYQVEPLLRGTMAAAASPEAGVNWILDLSRATRTPAESASFLEQIESFLPNEQKEPVLRRIIQIGTAAVAQAVGDARTFAQQELDRNQLNLLRYLVEHRRTDRARALLVLIANPPPDLEILIAAQSRDLPAQLGRYRQDPTHAPTKDVLQSTAAQLRNLGDEASARVVLEYLYTRELDAQELSATNFLGLAEIRLAAGDLTSAVALLRRMNLVSPEPFEDLMAAADLLEKTGHQPEAAEFLAVRERAVPWDENARLRLAMIRRTTATSAAVASNIAAPYETRVRAAVALSPASTQTGSGELDLLAAGNVNAAVAEKPLYFEARVRVASATKDPATRVRLLLGALAIDPEPQASRVALVRAAFDAGRPRIALAAADPILPRWWEGNEQAESELRNWAQAAANTFLADDSLTAIERAAIIERLAGTAESSGDLLMARRLLRIASVIDRTPQSDARLAAVTAEIRRLHENTLRRPVVSSNIEQPAIVRPILAAHKRVPL